MSYTATVLYVLTVFVSPLVKPNLYLRLYKKKVLHTEKKKIILKNLPLQNILGQPYLSPHKTACQMT